MKEISGSARRQHRRPECTGSRMMMTAKQIAPPRHMTCHAGHLGLGMA
jgi:hypothetical protein